MIDNLNYYENYDWDKADLSTKLKDKIVKLISVIPNDVKSILDVGCGDGVISNKLNNKYFVVATDRSLNAVKRVDTNKFQSSADYLPCKNNSFDMVFCSEMLEHLPQTIFEDTIEEFKRISKKYILLTFPNNENIEKHFVQCTKCKHIFNRSYHMRSITLKLIMDLFPGYHVITSFLSGSSVRDYKRFLGKIKHTFSSADSWIPLRWTPDGRRSSMCPKCSHKFEVPYKFNFISFFCDFLNALLSPKKPYQICILLALK